MYEYASLPAHASAWIRTNTGVAQDPVRALVTLRELHPDPYPVTRDASLPEVDLDEVNTSLKTLLLRASESDDEDEPRGMKALRKVVSRSPHLSSPHADGWRYEHLRMLMSKPDAGEAEAVLHLERALLSFCARVLTGDLPPRAAAFCRSGTLIALDKLNRQDRAEADALDPTAPMKVRPVAFGLVLVRLCGNILLELVSQDATAFLGDVQRGFRDPGGCEKITLLVRAAREYDRSLGAVALDLKNAFQSVSRISMREELVRDPRLHFLLPLFGLLYAEPGHLMYYAEP